MGLIACVTGVLHGDLLLEGFFTCLFLATRLAVNGTLLFHMKDNMVIIYIVMNFFQSQILIHFWSNQNPSNKSLPSNMNHT